MHNTNVIILAAGQGTRLRPYTDFLPKALVKLGGVPLLYRQVKTLNESRLSNIFVVTGYCEEKINDSRLTKIYNPEFATTNMVSSLYCAKHLFDGSADVIVSYGDIIYEKTVVSSLLSSEDNVSVIVDRKWHSLWSIRMEDPLSDAETLKLDKDGYIVELGKKPNKLEEIEAQYIGLLKISKSFAPYFFDLYESLEKDSVLYDGKDFKNMFMTTYLQLLIDNSVKIKAVPIHNGWLEVDSVDDLKRYDAMVANRTISNICNID